MVLHSDVALGRDAAVAFCKAQYGANAVLPPGSPAMMSAAQALVKQGQVRGWGWLYSAHVHLLVQL